MPDTLAPVVPCLVCGPDYLLNPANRRILEVPDETDLPEGCECPGCVSLRAEVERARAAAEVTTSTGPLTAEEGYDALYAARLSLRPAPGALTMDNPFVDGATPVRTRSACVTRTTSVMLCPEHFQQVRGECGGSRPCSWCGGVATSLSVTDEHDVPLQIVTIQLASRREAATGRRSPAWTDAYTAVEFDSPRPADGVCQTCALNAEECGDCGTRIQSGGAYECDDCEAQFCGDCYRSTHRRHRTEDVGRPSFYARASIEDMLANSGTPGTTIISTRALGVEIETARGNPGPVITSERNATVPVLAAVGSDGSVRGRNAVEFRLLPQRGVYAEYALRSMAAWCSDAGYRPDSSAGIHMHVDCSDLAVDKVWRAYAALVMLEGVLFSHADPERRASSYCAGLGADTERVIRTALAEGERLSVMDSYYRDRFNPDAAGVGSRYRAINCHSYSNHSTLEVRVFDSNHTPEGVERFTDAAAIIAGAVDFAVSADWNDFVAVERTDRFSTAIRLLSHMARAGHISESTLARAIARCDARITTTVPVAA